MGVLGGLSALSAISFYGAAVGGGGPPGGDVHELTDTFSNGPENFSVHIPEVGAWNLGSDTIVNGDGYLEFLQNEPFEFNSVSLTSGKIDLWASISVNDLSGLNEFSIAFNYFDIAECWKVVFNATEIKLFEVVGGVETQRGATMTWPEGVTSTEVNINTVGNDGDDVIVALDFDDIIYSITNRPNKDQTGIRIFSNAVSPTLLLMDYIDVARQTDNPAPSGYFGSYFGSYFGDYFTDGV